MTDDRPNPDALLAKVQGEEERTRGRLRVFFGYAAGVGKTYAMLEAARREKADGVDVVVGYVEPHGRVETEALLQGLEAIPFKDVAYRGVTLKEFDLDAALSRKPKLILVDELAHTNAPGSRHAKRWQDVEELLEAGIDVYTSLNVQHLESLNDVIAQISGVLVRETLPDAVLEGADEVELIDLPPDELLDRLREGKIYKSAQAERALDKFFQKGNLVSLRELSTRKAADRLHREVDEQRKSRGSASPWATRERLLVCVGGSPTTAKLIRATKRMADAQGAEWIAAAVQTAGGTSEAVVRHLRLAERLSAETQTLIGDAVAPTLIEYARGRNVTRIIVGKTAQPRWKRFLFRTVVDELLEISGPIDIHVIQGEAEGVERPAPQASAAKTAWNARDLLPVLPVVAVSGLLGWLCHLLKLSEANIVMVFLLGVAFAATRLGRGSAVLATFLSVLVFDFFFVPPYMSFAVSDAQYVLTFAIMLAVGLLIATLASRLRDRLKSSQEQEQRTAALFRLTRQLSELVGEEFLLQTAGRQLEELFPGDVLLFVRDPDGKLELRHGRKSPSAARQINVLAADWVASRGQVAGYGTDTLPNAEALFVPLAGSTEAIGALGVRPTKLETIHQPETRRLLETCARLIALAVERDRSILQAQDSLLKMQTEETRNTLLQSVSHDLRTPLAAIAGAAGNLERGADPAMLQLIQDETRRMTRLIDNLLEMTRLDAGTLKLNTDWHAIEDLIASAKDRLKSELKDHPLRVRMAEGLPLLRVDGILIEQVLVNLLENAARYTPAGSALEITAERQGAKVRIVVADGGPGLPAGAEDKVFEKFYRADAQRPDGRRGVGLGLAICKAVVEAHGGTIAARNRVQGGAEFVIHLPIPKEAA